MNKTALIATAVLLLEGAAISYAVDTGLQDEFELLTAKGATRRHVRAFHGTTPAKQLDYDVELGYPAAAIDSTHDKQLHVYGWKQCAAQDAGWVSIPDNSDEADPQCVYALNKSFIRANDLMRITMEYRTKLTKKWYCAPKPDNSRQSIIVVVYSFPDRESMRLDKLGLSCPK